MWRPGRAGLDWPASLRILTNCQQQTFFYCLLNASEINSFRDVPLLINPDMKLSTASSQQHFKIKKDYYVYLLTPKLQSCNIYVFWTFEGWLVVSKTFWSFFQLFTYVLRNNFGSLFSAIIYSVEFLFDILYDASHAMCILAFRNIRTKTRKRTCDHFPNGFSSSLNKTSLGYDCLIHMYVS